MGSGDAGDGPRRTVRILSASIPQHSFMTDALLPTTVSPAADGPPPAPPPFLSYSD